MATNGFDKDIERAREAGKTSKRGIDFPHMLKLILNSKLPAHVFEQLKEQFGLEENISQGETALRSIALKTIQRGDSKQLIDLLKITGDYIEKVRHETDKPLEHKHTMSEDTLDKLGRIITDEFGQTGPS